MVQKQMGIKGILPLGCYPPTGGDRESLSFFMYKI
jgi:hypothetical protein